MAKISVKDTEVSVIKVQNEDYISLTDMLKAKEGEFFFSNWLRNRNTVEFLGIWESLHNPDFNYVEFDIIKSFAGLNNFRLSAKEWRDSNPDLQGNIRDYASINELICLSNMESMNSIMIEEGLPQPERLAKLNEMAIRQMEILTKNISRNLLL